MFNVCEVATIMNVSQQTVRRWIEKGYLKAEKGLKKQGHKISEEALKTFILERPDLSKYYLANQQTVRRWIEKEYLKAEKRP